MANIAHYICKKLWAFPAPELHWELPFLGWGWWAPGPSSRSLPWDGGEEVPTPPCHSWHPQRLIFSMGAENRCLTVGRITQSQSESFGLERILKMLHLQSPTAGRDGTPWLEKSLLLRELLSRIISIFYEPQSCSSTAGVFYFLLLYLFSFTS